MSASRARKGAPRNTTAAQGELLCHLRGENGGNEKPTKEKGKTTTTNHTTAQRPAAGRPKTQKQPKHLIKAGHPKQQEQAEERKEQKRTSKPQQIYVHYGVRDTNPPSI